MNNKTILVNIMKNNFLSCLQMLNETINCCPEKLWSERNGGYPFWQQIYHVLEGTDFWFRTHYSEKLYDNNAPKLWSTNKNVTYNLNETVTVFDEILDKEELKEYMRKTVEKTNNFFNQLTDEAISTPVVAGENEFTYLDIIDMQIRHVMYHVGYCMCILRENGADTVDWISHNERDE